MVEGVRRSTEPALTTIPLGSKDVERCGATVLSETQKERHLPMACTEVKRSIDLRNTYQPTMLQGCRSNSGSSSQPSKGSPQAENKMKASLSLSSLRTENLLGSPAREREVKSEERCLQKSAGTPTHRCSPVLDRDRILRRSPTNKDECWDSLWTHYNYLMDEGLIATCREASGDLSWDDEEISPTYNWSFTEFIQQFNLLHDWLHRLQSTVAGTDENGCRIENSNAAEELQKVVYLCKLFNEQAQKLGKRYPDMKDEINRRMNLLNNKWEAVAQAIDPHKPQPSEDGVFQEVAYQMRCLRKWLRDLESRLQPITISPNWTMQDLEDKYRGQQVLQKEIESLGKYVSSLLKLCERLGGDGQPSTTPVLIWDAERVRRVATNLEHRWHALWLRSLEYQCLVEEFIRKYKSGCLPGDPNFELSFSEEPLKKYPRLSGEWDDIVIPQHELIDKMETELIEEDACASDQQELNTNYQEQDGRKEIGVVCGFPGENPSTNDKGIMVGTTSIAELKAECGGSIGRFEIVQDIGYSSESSAQLSNDERQESIRVYSYSPVHSGPALVSEYTITGKSKDNSIPVNVSTPVSKDFRGVSQSSILYLPPDKYPSISLKGWQFASDDDPLEAFKNRNILPSPDSSFYKMTSIDAENSEDKLKYNSDSPYAGKDSNKVCCDMEVQHDISDFEFERNRDDVQKNNSDFQETLLSDIDSNNLGISSTLTGGSTDLSSGLLVSEHEASFTSPAKACPPPLDVIHDLMAQADKLVCEGRNSESCHQQIPHKGRRARVREWLQSCSTVGETNGTNCQKHQGNEGMSRDLNGAIIDSSCDASGEYTTNESDGEHSSSSDCVNNSLVLTRSYAGSVETVVPLVSEEKKLANEDRSGSVDHSLNVVMRSKKKLLRDRPWSVTEMHHLPGQLGLSLLSTSEGALHTLLSSKSSCSKNVTSRLNHTSSSKSRKSPSPSKEHILPVSHNKPRRHRSRGSLHNSTHRSDSGSDSLSPGSKQSRTQSLRYSTGSDSAQHSTPTRHRRSSSSLHNAPASDGASPSHFRRSSLHHSSRSSISGSSNCSRNKGSPSVSDVCQVSSNQLPKTQNITKNESQVNSIVRPSSVADSDQAFTQTEDQSSVSDQVWDGYQDPPYMSEPYSEQTADEDQIKRLTEFGDDYRAFISSHSDISSVGKRQESKRPYQKAPQSSYSSRSQSISSNNTLELFHFDSDSDVEDLHHVLTEAKHALQVAHTTLKNHTPLTRAEYIELFATCQTHLKCLQDVKDHMTASRDIGIIFGEEFQLMLEELIEQWKGLQSVVLTLKQQDPCQIDISWYQKDIENKIISQREMLASLAAVASKPLETLGCLEDVKVAIEELQMSLSTLRQTNEAVRETQLRIHRLMSEAGLASCSLKDDFTQLYQCYEDVYEQSGSQLTRLQKLYAKWEQYALLFQRTVDALKTMDGNATEEEFLRAAASVKDQMSQLEQMLNDMKEPMAGGPVWRALLQELTQAEAVLRHRQIAASEMTVDGSCDNGANDCSKSKDTPSRFWRVVRAALPFQLALVLLYCLACLLEPRCCDNLNNLNFSLWPQLRYVRGPPPI